jgi:citrate lyase beta subunit
MERETVTTTLPARLLEEVAARLAPLDAELAARYPGDPGTRQPVHTVYVPADRFTAGTAAAWGREALAALDRHAPDAAAFGRLLELPDPLAGPVHARVRAKLLREPVEDLRIDFEDGYGLRPDAEEDADALRAATALADALDAGTAPPFAGLRVKALEAAVRARGLRTLDVFLTALTARTPLPPGFAVTLPKVSDPRQPAAFARLLAAFERERGLPDGALRFEVQVETTAAVLGADGTATLARFLDAGAGRVTGLHYGTFDYSAACGVAPELQAMDHPAADYAKAVMQAAAAGTGVRVSDGSTNVVPAGDEGQVRDAWRLHYRLVRRSLARAFYQGWDMHPGHLPTRYAAVYAFHREGLAAAGARVAAYLAGTGSGTVLDEPATAKALAGHLLRGTDCGALDPGEAAAAAGAARADLERLAGRG